MTPHGHRRSIYILAALALMLACMFALDEVSAGPEFVNLIKSKPGASGTGTMPGKGENLNIRPGPGRDFYDRTIAGSRFRDGQLNWDLLMRLIREPPGHTIALKLMPDVAVMFTPTRYAPIKSFSKKKTTRVNKYRWTGVVRSLENGKVVGEGLFVVDQKQQRITATIGNKDKVYEIVPLKNGDVRIYELNLRRFPEDTPETTKSPVPPGETNRPVTHDELTLRRFPEGTPETTNPPVPPGETNRPVTHDELDPMPLSPEPGDEPRTELDSSPCVIGVLVFYTQDADNVCRP